VGAITDCEKALDLDPKLVLAHLHRGALRRAKSEFEGAIADFTAAIEVEPTPELHLERGITHASLGAFDQAIADYTRAIEIKPDLAPAYFNRAVAKQSSGDPEGSKADFEKVLQLVPPGHRLRGQAEKRLRGEPTS
jgi:tetratricopeptide (TPR) repeat protein